LANVYILDKLDHRYLNDVLPLMNTTAENMVVWMYEQLTVALYEAGFSPRVELAEVKLWETPTSYASITREQMEDPS
jgi:6-pyruvoyltetrahydropterin/6-carboxytetrahydropterin synthase